MRMHRKLSLATLVAGCSIAVSVIAGPAARDPSAALNAAEPRGAPPGATSGLYRQVPLTNWTVDSKTAITQLNAQRKTNGLQKAAADSTTWYRPLTPCRLIDTRGLPAAVAVAGPLMASSDTNIAAAGNCGIPAGVTAGISMTVVVFNTTPGNGGFISLRQQGTAVTGVNMVFTAGAEWLGTTGNISILDNSGNFAIYVAGSNVHVIVDINGYYQDLNEFDSNTQFDINGTTGGDLFAVNNLGAGTALVGSAGTGGTGVSAAGTTGLATFGSTSAIVVQGGDIRAAGAGVGTTGFAFIHQVNSTAFGSGGNACGGFPQYTVITHPMLDNDPTALVFITPRGLPEPSNGPFTAFYIASGCSPSAAGHWAIKDRLNAAHVNSSQFNVMIIKP